MSSTAKSKSARKPQSLTLSENGLHILVDIAADGDARLVHFSCLPFEPALLPADDQRKCFRLVEIQASGENHAGLQGSKYLGTFPAARLRYRKHRDQRNPHGRKIEIILAEDGGLEATIHWQFYDGIPVVRAWTAVTNTAPKPIGLEYVTSFCLTGLAKEGLGNWDVKSRLHLPHNTWYGEAQWREYRLPDLGLYPVVTGSIKRLAFSNTGTWSASGLLPMGCYENRECGTSLAWQIEHNGSWHWELSDCGPWLYLHLSGPTENENLWWKNLKPGETFTTVPVAVTATAGGLQDSIVAFTHYRRALRRPHKDNRRLAVIFNDYMNCLWGDPTTEKLKPLIEAAARAGCEYFCIDAGWHGDSWWDSVGEWKPSEKRFPNGIGEVLDLIRSKGMVPGLWLEIEVMGLTCHLAAQAPDSWFFMRHGRRVIHNGRYQLDFRHPDVVRHADQVVDRLVREYGVGYIKIDYNINAGPGTEVAADSFGDGLLDHNRAYLRWLDAVLTRYPKLVVENCGSGGMRLDWALLSRLPIQSCSDQTDYRKMAVVAAASPSVLPPEQAAIWAYPLHDADREAVIFNMVNTLLLRIHQSGHLAQLPPEHHTLVAEAIASYKSYRKLIPQSRPFWPLGLPKHEDQWASLGLDAGARSLLAVWRFQSRSDTCELPLPHLAGRPLDIQPLFPKLDPVTFRWNRQTGILTVKLPQDYCARLLSLTPSARSTRSRKPE